ncbi:MAG: hypothetical protein OEV30_07455 [Ignavibacteria bacterium]|nr:hypothetical protein [Ignavibacteria bacterium]
MKQSTIISKDRRYLIELTHRNADPGVWIVRRWKRFLGFRRRLSSDWFNDEKQALLFANRMKQRYGGR